MFGKVNNDGDKQHLQNDLDKLVKWSEKIADVILFWELSNAYMQDTGT